MQIFFIIVVQHKPTKPIFYEAASEFSIIEPWLKNPFLDLIIYTLHRSLFW